MFLNILKRPKYCKFCGGRLKLYKQCTEYNKHTGEATREKFLVACEYHCDPGNSRYIWKKVKND